MSLSSVTPSLTPNMQATHPFPQIGPYSQPVGVLLQPENRSGVSVILSCGQHLGFRK